MNSETAKSNARPAKKYVWTAIEHPGVGMLSIRFETIYGNRCMYVARDGVQIGYYNIGTGTNGGKTSIDREDIERAAEIALRAELTRPTAIVPGVGLVADMVRARSEDADRSALVAPGTRIPSSSESDSDLALNQPGAGVQSRADALRRAAPWKSRIARVLGIKTEERSWRIGAVGERRIAATLCTLGTEWHVIHGIPVGDRDGDIDHLVIGPGGVFSVNSKNHPNAKVWVGGNTVLLNGRPVAYIHKSRYEATRASKLISMASGMLVPVRGVVALAGSERSLTIREQPRDRKVVVITRKHVVGFLTNLAPIYDAATVDRIFAIARLRTTWQRYDGQSLTN